MSNTSGSANSTDTSVGPSKQAAQGLRAALEAMLSGVQTAIPDGSDVLVAGVKVAKADLVAKLQASLSQYIAIAAHAAELKAERQAKKQALSEERQLLRELKDAVITNFGRGSPEIEKFGFQVRGRRQLTSQERALVAEKARRTRALRGTKGSRQKAAIRFTGEPTLVLGGSSPEPSPAQPVASVSKPPATSGGE